MTRSSGYRPPAKRKTLAGVIGAAAAAIALTMTPMEESGRTVAVSVAPSGEATVRHVAGRQYLAAYLDLVGVATACDGITKGVKLGQRYTEAQCARLLEDELVVHAEGLMACAPQLKAPALANVRAAGTVWTYNVGVGAACGSTAVRRWRAGDVADGCRAMAMWDKAGRPPRVVRGLALRRAREVKLCLTGLAA